MVEGNALKVTFRADTEQEMTFDVGAVSRKLNPLKMAPTDTERAARSQNATLKLQFLVLWQ